MVKFELILVWESQALKYVSKEVKTFSAYEFEAFGLFLTHLEAFKSQTIANITTQSRPALEKVQQVRPTTDYWQVIHAVSSYKKRSKIPTSYVF